MTLDAQTMQGRTKPLPLTLVNLTEMLATGLNRDGEPLGLRPTHLLVPDTLAIALVTMECAVQRLELIGEIVNALGRRPHPRRAILAALAMTSAPYREIAWALRRPPKTVERWMQRLRRAGLVEYRRPIGYFLRSEANS